MSAISIITTPDANEVWSGIAGHFDSLGQIINEFVDNSISNFDKNNTRQKNILITLKEQPIKNSVQVIIEDTGTGIKNLNSCFTLGCRKAAETPLNEHGFGLKHALASANPENNSWDIYTRTEEDLHNHKFVKISAPYSFSEFHAEEYETKETEWTGTYSTSGTIVSFECSRAMFQTLARGIKGGLSDFKKIAALLYEDLAFVYSGIIKSGRASISLEVIPADGEKTFITIGALEPDWIKQVPPGEGTDSRNLGNGNVTIEYSFGIIQSKDNNDNYEFTNSKTKKYYQTNMSSSGVEIRINGRMICYNLFKEIWGIEKHNSYNSFLAIINLITDDSKALPKTRTSKNGLREGDPQLEELFEWIREMLPIPERDAKYADHETDLFNMLCSQKNSFNPDPNKIITTERKVFLSSGNSKDAVRIDLFEKTMGQITIYEGKIDQTTSKDVYQLRMYWDGLVFDRITPTTGILVSARHPESVRNMIALVNTMKDCNGNNYNLICKTWKDLNIQYTTKKTDSKHETKKKGS